MMTNPDLLCDVFRSREGAPLLPSGRSRSQHSEPHRNSRPRRTVRGKDLSMFQFTIRYARYALSTLAAVGFRLN
jgi:hypothetical protein